MLAAADAERMEQAVERALVETLGPADAQKVYAHVERRLREEHVPKPQLALMWVSAHMPRAAERVLATAREQYRGAAAA
jgi:hypothetical protein